MQGAESYLLYMREVGQVRPLPRVVGGTEIVLPDTAPPADSTFEWWVAAMNDYAVGAESSHWQFHTPSRGDPLTPSDFWRL